MKTYILENSSHISLANELQSSFIKSDTIEIASAFITSWSIRFLKDNLLHSNKKVMLLIGLFGKFNKQQDLKSLLSLQNNSHGKLLVRISRNARFHWKYYRFSSNKLCTFYIGSANFTKEGLDKEGEFMLKLENKLPIHALEASSKAFGKMWGKSIKLEDFPILKYHEVKRSKKNDLNNPIDESIKGLLKNPPFISTVGSNNHKVHLRYIKVKETLSNKAEKVIASYHSNWSANKYKYKYICFPYKKDFQQISSSDFLLYQYWHNTKWYFEIVKVLDSDDSLSTTDGRYLVAFKKEKVRTKQISQQFNVLLLSCGIKYNGRKYSIKSLGEKQSQKIFDAFNLQIRAKP